MGVLNYFKNSDITPNLYSTTSHIIIQRSFCQQQISRSRKGTVSFPNG